MSSSALQGKIGVRMWGPLLPIPAKKHAPDPLHSPFSPFGAQLTSSETPGVWSSGLGSGHQKDANQLGHLSRVFSQPSQNFLHLPLHLIRSCPVTAGQHGGCPRGISLQNALSSMLEYNLQVSPVPGSTTEGSQEEAPG